MKMRSVKTGRIFSFQQGLARLVIINTTSGVATSGLSPFFIDAFELDPANCCVFKLQGLIRLHLTDNKLTSFAFNDGCLPSLKVLDLSQNQLVTVPMRLWDGLPVLNTIDISSNPLRCDCALAPFIERLSESASSSLNQVRFLFLITTQVCKQNNIKHLCQ